MTPRPATPPEAGSVGRRAFLGLLAAGAVGGGLAACGGGSGSSGDGSGAVTLRVVWWGSDDRHKATQAALDLFTKNNPSIRVEASPLPFDGYFDQLTTQIAANDAPDVQQLTGDYVIDYGSRSALLALDDVPAADLDEASVQGATIDGKVLGVPTGLATQVVVANPDLFAKAKEPLPDDATWTWDDYADIAKRISDALPGDVFGAGQLGLDPAFFGSYVRQQGKNLWTQDGKLGFGVEQVVPYMTLAKRMQDSGAAPGAAQDAEEAAGALEQTGTATNRFALGMWATAQFPSLVKASGTALRPLLLPSLSGKLGGQKMGVGASQYWSGASRSKHPEQAQQLINFLVNDPEAGKLLGVVRGTPPNAKVRETVTPTLSPTDAQVAKFVGRVQTSASVGSLPPAPPGTGTLQDVLRRYFAEFLFDRMPVQEAAQKFVSEAEALVA